MKKSWGLAVLSGILAIGTLAFAQSQEEGSPPSSGTARAVQPLAFQHDTHAGENRIDCQFCHYSAERSKVAGVPPVMSCMGCHREIEGRNMPEEVGKLRGYWQRGEPIPWVRIYAVADHVTFPHMRHVAANGNMECRVCHGSVEEVGVIETTAQPLRMGWCVECHREREASVDCTACHI